MEVSKALADEGLLPALSAASEEAVCAEKAPDDLLAGRQGEAAVRPRGVSGEVAQVQAGVVPGVGGPVSGVEVGEVRCAAGGAGLAERGLREGTEEARSGWGGGSRSEASGNCVQVGGRGRRESSAE